MPQHVRKGDQVMVIAGDDKNKTGRILRVDPRKSQVVVEGVNVVRRHVRPNAKQPQGGVVQKEMPIHWSNVQPVADGKPTRVRFEQRDNGTKVRVAVRGGSQIGAELKKAR